MTDLTIKLIKGEPITDEDIANELCEICEREHASCNSDCPLYEETKDKPNCIYCKNGKMMLKYLRKKLTSKKKV